MFSNKTILITGGTGTFGNAVLHRFLETDISEIRIFSRDEKKQDEMRNALRNPKVKFYLGNVRDYDSILAAMINVDLVFHAAALKQVPSCEFFPLEAVRTNTFGCGKRHECSLGLRGQKYDCPEHGQGGLSHQCHGHVQGAHGKDDGCQGTGLRGFEHHLLRDPLWECYGLARLRDPVLHQPDSVRNPHHGDGSEYDALHDVYR